MLKDFEKKITLHKETISSGRRITTYIYARSLMISLLRKYTRGRDLTRPTATQFATSYLTLTWLREHQVSLINLFIFKIGRITSFHLPKKERKWKECERNWQKRRKAISKKGKKGKQSKRKERM